MLNPDSVRYLADVIERQPDTQFQDVSGFCMRTFFHSYGTPACLAGWSSHLVKEGEMLPMGLNNEQAKLLFYPKFYYANFFAQPGQDGYITARHAAAVLRNLADTGEVDWRVPLTDPAVTEAIEELIASTEEVGVS